MQAFVLFLVSLPALTVSILVIWFGFERVFGLPPYDGEDEAEKTIETPFADLALDTAATVGRFYCPDRGVEIVYDRGCYRLFLKRTSRFWVVYPCDRQEAFTRITQYLEELHADEVQQPTPSR